MYYKLPTETWGCLVQVTNEFWNSACETLSHAPGITDTNACLIHEASKGGRSQPKLHPLWKVFLSQESLANVQVVALSSYRCEQKY